MLFAQDDDEIRIDSSVVIVNASIKTADGRNAGGLKKEQFKILEDGVEQKVEYFSAEQTPFAAAILLDTSGSMEERVSMARSAAIRFLDGLRSTDSAAIYRFDSKIELVQPFSNSRDIAEAAFDLKAYGMTKMNDAIYQAAVDLSKRDEKRKAIIVLSDGQDNLSSRSADKALKAAMSADILIYTIDMSPVGDSKRVQNQGALKNLAEKSGGTFVSTPGGAAMRDAFEKIVEELGMQYTLGYSPLNTKTDGKWRAIELRVAKPNLTIRTRKGYNAEKGK
ncbi:MAG TPA: VWA domain-containing protein [Pyrinomonadaceae bacterium]|nr:VWA domain-containing protein [Pyrinomonadaceae bacterium]